MLMGDDEECRGVLRTLSNMWFCVFYAIITKNCQLLFFSPFGADDGGRTRDLRHGKATL